jgi:uncharacterized membrane-anchored protein
MLLRRVVYPAFILCALSISSASADSTGKGAREKVKFQYGPATANMKGIAQVTVPEGYLFADAKGAQALMEAMGNIKSDQEVGLIAPTSMVWFVVFEFDPVGYVKDQDKDQLDADKMLASITQATEQFNKKREKMQVAPMKIVGWDVPPHYDAETHNLQWTIRGESQGEFVVNQNTRLLGRKGVMRVTLVGDPKEVETALPDYQKLLGTYSFTTGQRYAEFRSGDKVAKYGLAALVVGGAAVGAAKLGLFAWAAVLLKKAWKLVIIAVAACASAIKKLFSKITGSKRTSDSGPTV